jgi:hypothetical protein
MLPVYAAIDLYGRAVSRGRWYRRWMGLRGRPSRLLDLATFAAAWTIRSRRSAGQQAVPIAQIRGSEGRSDDFDVTFHPLKDHVEGRWRNIAQAWLEGRRLPPVDLIRVGDVYFVRDGHHRISVARSFGQREIDAYVTVWEAEQPRERAQGAPAPRWSAPFASRRLRWQRAWLSAESAAPCEGV